LVKDKKGYKKETAKKEYENKHTV